MKTKFTISEIYSNRLTAQKASYLKSVRKLILCLIFGLLFLSGINAQTIMSFDNGLQSLDPLGANHLQSLATDINPNVYLDHGELTTYGEGAPVVAITDGSSVNMLYSNEPSLSQVELIKIIIHSPTELPSAIDLTRMKALANLKCLLVIFAYDVCGGGSDGCIETKLNGIINGASAPFSVFYKLSIPE